MNESPSPSPVLLFDGVCNLCNGAVNWIIDHDPKGRILFGTLQSEAGAHLLAHHGLDPAYLESLVLVEGDRVFLKSAAALRVAYHLGGGWGTLWKLRHVPARFRDALYDYVAQHRYRWFGRQESCRVPTPELKARFL